MERTDADGENIKTPIIMISIVGILSFMYGLKLDSTLFYLSATVAATLIFFVKNYSVDSYLCLSISLLSFFTTIYVISHPSLYILVIISICISYILLKLYVRNSRKHNNKENK